MTDPTTPNAGISDASPPIPQTLHLGDLQLQSPFLVAPLEAVSDVAFRHLAHRAGAGLTWTEMIRARGIVKHNKSTLDLIDTTDPDTPTGLQLLVTQEHELETTLAILDELARTTRPQYKNIVALDLNFGCPSQDVVRIGAGPAMLKRRNKLRAIFEVLKAARDKAKAGTLALPLKSVSAKIRLGLNEGEQHHKVYLPVIEMANDTLDYVVVHARHAKQRSRDPVTWSAIGECKAIARIPILGNGDVRTRADAIRMRTETGCDGFMIARAAVHNPLCFRELTGQGEARPSAADVQSAADDIARFESASPPKDKHRAFHQELLNRLRALSRGETVTARMPKNAHLQE